MKYPKPRSRDHPNYPLKNALEDAVAGQLQRHYDPEKKRPITQSYEKYTLSYVLPVSSYKPDFVLPNGIILEVKGFFEPTDRVKHLLIKEQHPKLDIRFIFTNAKARLNPRSKTTYAEWCRKNGFLCAEKRIPEEWLHEPATKDRKNAVVRSLKRREEKEEQH